MSTSTKKKKDWRNAQLKKQPPPNKQAELRDEFANLIEFKKELDEAKGQLIDETIKISESIYWLDKNKDACPTKLTTVVVRKLSNSKDAKLKKMGTDMAKHIVIYDTSVVEWKDPTKRKEAVQKRINNNYNKIIAGFEKYKAIMIEEIAAQDTNSATAQSALASSKATLDKADQKNPNTQQLNRDKAAKDKHAKAELELQLYRESNNMSIEENNLQEEELMKKVEETNNKTAKTKTRNRMNAARDKHAEAEDKLQTFRASKNDLSNDENKLQEEKLVKDVESLSAKTGAGTIKRHRDRNNEKYKASKAKLSELERKQDNMNNEEYTEQLSILLEDVAEKKTKTEAGKYQEQNKICGYTKEHLVGIAVMQLSSLHIPFSAPVRSEELCEQFSEAFLSRDPEKVASLFFD